MEDFLVLVDYLEQMVTSTNAGKGEVQFFRNDGGKVVITYLPPTWKGGLND